MTLDDDLRRALRRTNAPPELADRVLNEIAAGPLRGTRPTHDAAVRGTRPTHEADNAGAPATAAWPWRRWLVTAAAVALVATGGTRYYLHQRMLAEAERIEAEVRLAFEITQQKIELVQQRINDTETAR